MVWHAKAVKLVAAFPFHLRRSHWEEGAQLVELALSLPILLLFLLGIISFGGAFEQRNEMAIAAREAARFAASESTLDLNQAVPPSIQAIHDVVQNDLTNDGLTSCSLSGAPAQAGLQWTYTTGCGASLVINRGYTTLSTNGVTYLEGTEIQLSYPYTWTFAGSLGIVASLPASLSVEAIMMNAP